MLACVELTSHSPSAALINLVRMLLFLILSLCSSPMTKPGDLPRPMYSPKFGSLPSCEGLSHQGPAHVC